MKTHIFIVNTPFQSLVVNLIIDRFFREDDNIVFSTIDNIVISNCKLMIIRKDIFSFSDSRHFRKEIEQKARLNIVDFFIPHINNFFSSYCYKFSKKYGHELNIYYEGIALFYDPIVSINKGEYIKRCIYGFLSGLGYRHSSLLYPEALKNNAEAYTPLPKYTNGFRNTIPFSFPHSEIQKNGSLLIGSPLERVDDLTYYLQSVKSLLSLHPNLKSITFKPHFKSQPKLVKSVERFLVHQFQKATINILDKNVPLEILPLYANIFSVHISSALINMKLINSGINIFVLDKGNEKINLIANDLGINFVL